MTEKTIEDFIVRKKKSDAEPIDRAAELRVSPAQRASSDSDFRPVIDSAQQDSRNAIVENWRRENGGAQPTEEQVREGFVRLASTNPVNVDERAVALARTGTARVTDPEGRIGTPVYVAGTDPDGRPVALNAGDVARLSSAVANLDAQKLPGSDWGGTTFNGPTPAPGQSANAIGFNVDYSKNGVGPADVLAHETGHALHNYLGKNANPFEGADSLALGDFSRMIDARAKADGVRTPTMGGRMTPADNKSFTYYLRPQEGFAEGVRMYLRDPNGFKTNFPNAARFLRGVINTDPHLSRLLMLSQAPANTNPTA